MNLANTVPVISVVMAVYNGQRYLTEAIRSILNQTFVEFELIVVDDGSMDGSREIAIDCSHCDPRMRVISQEHSGVIPALNLGCSFARGKYIARLDGDDIAKPWRLEKQLAHLQLNDDTVLLGGSTECIDSNGTLMFVMRWPSWEAGLRDYLLLDCCIAHTTVMFRKDRFFAVGGYRSQFQDAEDYDLFLRMSDRYRVDNLPVVLCQYRLHRDQASANRMYQQIVSGIGAKMATRARRANRPEPNWTRNCVEREDLIALGVKQDRLDALVSEYASSNSKYSEGWRWSKLPFCELIPHRQQS